MPVSFGLSILKSVTLLLLCGVGVFCALGSTVESARANDGSDWGRSEMDALFQMYQQHVPFDASVENMQRGSVEFQKSAKQSMSHLGINFPKHRSVIASALNECVADYLNRHKTQIVSINEAAHYRAAAASSRLGYDPDHVRYILNFAAITLSLVKKEFSVDIYLTNLRGRLGRLVLAAATLWYASNAYSAVVSDASAFMKIFATVSESSFMFLTWQLASAYGLLLPAAGGREMARQLLMAAGISNKKTLSKLSSALNRGDIEPVRAHFCEMALQPEVEPEPESAPGSVVAQRVRIAEDLSTELSTSASAGVERDEVQDLTEDDMFDVEVAVPAGALQMAR